MSRLARAVRPRPGHSPPLRRRSADATKQAYTDGTPAVIDGIAARLAPADPQSARVKALGILALMAGTLQLSRALADPELADEVLEQGTRNVLALLELE